MRGRIDDDEVGESDMLLLTLLLLLLLLLLPAAALASPHNRPSPHKRYQSISQKIKEKVYKLNLGKRREEEASQSKLARVEHSCGNHHLLKLSLFICSPARQQLPIPSWLRRAEQNTLL